MWVCMLLNRYPKILHNRSLYNAFTLVLLLLSFYATGTIVWYQWRRKLGKSKGGKFEAKYEPMIVCCTSTSSTRHGNPQVQEKERQL